MEPPLVHEKDKAYLPDVSKEGQISSNIEVKDKVNDAASPSEGIQEADSSTSTNKSMIKWHIPKPPVSMMKTAPQESIVVPPPPVQNSVSSTIVTSTVEPDNGHQPPFNQVSSTTCDPKTSLAKPGN